jgi:hypothetical protein
VTEYRAGGRRRVDRLLDPAVLAGTSEVGEAELATHLEEARAEETELSYIRRLLQGRLDILRAEQVRRSSGDASAAASRTDADLVASLARVLVDDTRRAAPPAPTTGPIEIVSPPLGLRRRAAERAIDDVELSDPTALDDERLAAAIARLEDLERTVSRTRRGIHRVLDALTAEVDRRVSEGAMVSDQPLP